MIIFRRRVAGLGERGLVQFASRAQRAAGIRGEVSVLLTSSRQLQVFNSRFRRKNTPTDVLSFQAVADTDGEAGDIAISVDIAAQNARSLGHTTAEEVRILILHGLLHLAGYDHEQDHGEMARREQRLRKQLGLPVGLIERNSGGEGEPLSAKGAKVPRRARSKSKTMDKNPVRRKAR